MATDDADFWKTRTENGQVVWERFEPYNVEKDLKKLKPYDKGRVYAVSDPKVEDERQLTSIEMDLLAAPNEKVVELKDWFVRGSGAIQSEIEQFSEDVDVSGRLADIENSFRKKKRQAFESFYAANQDSFAERRLRELELRGFRAKHGLLDRPAHYPDSLVLHFALVIMALVLEAVANAYFFGEASDIGLLGGFLTAFLVSLANVALSMLAGVFFLRAILHKSVALKVVGVLGFVSILCVLAFLHLAIAHYRELLMRSPESEIFSALSTVWANPLGLQDLESLLLVSIGWVISAFAIWKGYTMDDPYLRYGAVWRRWDAKHQEMVKLQASLRGQIGAAFDESTQRTEEYRIRLLRRREYLGGLKGDIEGFLRACEAYYEAAVDGANRLVGTYRSAIHAVNNDEKRFPFTEETVFQPNGLRSLDPSGMREEIWEIYNARLEALEGASTTLADKSAESTARLDVEHRESTSTQAIQNTLDEIQRHGSSAVDGIGNITVDLEPIAEPPASGEKAAAS